MENFPVLETVSKDFNSFVEFWSEPYQSELDETRHYSETIKKTKFEKIDLENLYIWKNQMLLSKPKENSFNRKISDHIDRINELKIQPEIIVEDFFKEFNEVSAVWRIFLLHCIKPDRFPIYDQHVHRALSYINGESTKEITADMKDSEKLEYYINAYLPFFQKYGIENPKKFDEAMVSFGQFVGRNKILLS